jgi:hypothetical protein
MDQNTSKVCSRCKQAKTTDCFSTQSKRPDGLHVWCKDCCRDYNREYSKRPGKRERRIAWRRENETYNRVARVHYLYGISGERYDALLLKQGGRCAICRTDKPGGRWNTWHVDHDHAHCPGKRACETCVRGLLCSGCNVALGYFRDDPAMLTAAIRYLAGESG